MEAELNEYFENLKEVIDFLDREDADVETKFKMVKTTLSSMADQIRDLHFQINRLNKDFYDLE